MPDKTAEKQVAINILVDGTWHRAFELTEQGERHIMAWKGCPLNEVDTLDVDNISRGPLLFGPGVRLCPPCFEDELREDE